MGFTVDKDQGKEVEPSDAQQARSPMDKRSGQGTSRWIKAIYTLCVLAVLVMAGFEYVKWTLRVSLEYKPQQYAVGSVRKLVTSQISYRGTIGGGTYADSLDSLYASNLIDSVLASGTKEGYTFIVSTDAGSDSFAIYATPITYDDWGSAHSFFSDETGVIRYTAEERPATVDDKPLGQ